MSLRDQFTAALKTAMLAKDERTVSTLRMMLAKLKDKDIEARPKGISDGIKEDEILTLLQSMVKQRRESIALYQQGKREDLVKQESEEIAVIERFMPTQMDEAAMNTAIDAIVAATGASSVKDMGKVMGELKKAYSGQMDFAAAGARLKARLADAP